MRLSERCQLEHVEFRLSAGWYVHGRCVNHLDKLIAEIGLGIRQSSANLTHWIEECVLGTDYILLICRLQRVASWLSSFRKIAKMLNDSLVDDQI